MRDYKSRGLRAVKGSIGGRVLVSFQADLLKALRRAAKQRKISVSEFVRSAVRAALNPKTGSQNE